MKTFQNYQKSLQLSILKFDFLSVKEIDLLFKFRGLPEEILKPI